MPVQRKRHIAKAFTWRAVASLSTFLIGWIATDNVTTGLSIGAVDAVIKLILYYVHERVWYRFRFGIIHDESGHPEH